MSAGNDQSLNLRSTSYCACWHNSPDQRSSWPPIPPCACGECNNYFYKWKWKLPPASESSFLVVNGDGTKLLFHSVDDSGAAGRGYFPLQRDRLHYFEIKMLTETDSFMVGVGTDKVYKSANSELPSLLGRDGESYGLSYTGEVWHNTQITQRTDGFCRGTIVGVRVDLWRGTLEFYLNRVYQGVSFYDLRRHPDLYPIVCSTANRSAVRIIFTASWRASLLVDSAKILAASTTNWRAQLFPGLRRIFTVQSLAIMPHRGFHMQ